MAWPRWKAALVWATLAVVSLGGGAEAQFPQTPGAHYLHDAWMPPGAIGSRQLSQRGGPLVGYFQPVEFTAPAGAMLSLPINGRFEPPAREIVAGLPIGQVYRLRVTNIPRHEGEEVFPTIEIIDRIHPPAHVALKFPISVEISQNDLELAIAGKFVTRVIYVEDPRNALPAAQRRGEQDWFDAKPGQDPLRVADALGRPVAILRMGGRVPEDTSQPDMKFLFGCPPFHKLPPVPKDGVGK